MFPGNDCRESIKLKNIRSITNDAYTVEQILNYYTCSAMERTR